MSIGLTDKLAPLGTFPLVEDVDIQGGFRALNDTTERDAIDTGSRKAGMLVWTQTEGALWRLGSGLTNGDWVDVTNASSGMGDVQIDVSNTIESASPVTLHSYTDPDLENRGTICYDVLVTAIAPFGGRYAAFKIVGVFEREGTTITEQDITFVNGPVNPNPVWDVTFSISGATIDLQVTGEVNGAGGVRWRAVGYITRTDATFPEA